jgi:hypothetical protein
MPYPTDQRSLSNTISIFDMRRHLVQLFHYTIRKLGTAISQKRIIKAAPAKANPTTRPSHTPTPSHPKTNPKM